MYETLAEARFDETARIQDLIGQIHTSIDQGVTGSGHSHAMMAANQNASPVASWSLTVLVLQGFKPLNHCTNKAKPKTAWRKSASTSPVSNKS